MNNPPPPANFLKDVIARFGGDAAAAPRRRPPIHKWNPDFCGLIDMRIARDGSWHYMGSPISRVPMVKLFASILRREPDDSYVLVTPVEKVGITVDDVPFTAVEMVRDGSGTDQRLAFRTNLDEVVPLDADHPLRVEINADTGEPSPYILVRDRLEARISRPVYYELAEIADQHIRAGRMTAGLWSAGTYFTLGDCDAG